MNMMGDFASVIQDCSIINPVRGVTDLIEEHSYDEEDFNENPEAIEQLNSREIVHIGGSQQDIYLFPVN
jgi:hypothetical protein